MALVARSDQERCDCDLRLAVWIQELTGSVKERDAVLDEAVRQAWRVWPPTADKLGWHGARVIKLEPAERACGQCAQCGGWVTNSEKPDPMPKPCNGAISEGRLLCDEHVPLVIRRRSELNAFSDGPGEPAPSLPSLLGLRRGCAMRGFHAADRGACCESGG